MSKSTLKTIALVAPALFLLNGCGSGNHVNNSNRYVQTNLIANSAAYATGNDPLIINPDLQDAWGISLRPAGVGGHWWLQSNHTGKSIEYIGDSPGNPLHQDTLQEVTVNGSNGEQGEPTGTVFNVSGTGFVINQPNTPFSNTNFTAPAKFFFATDTGVVDAWTETTNTDGSPDRPHVSVKVWDQEAQSAAYFGIAIAPTFDKLYLADFGIAPRVVILNDQFQDVSVGKFANPYPGFSPFNVQSIGTSIFVAYAKQESPAVEVHGIGQGRLAEFDTAGNLIARWDDRNLLNAPWGIVMAPATGFGLYSGKLLVSNFGNGTITVFDPQSKQAIDYIRTANGTPLSIDGIWDLKVGNGVAQGETDAVYFTAGPNGEADGVFGKIKATP